MIIKLSPQVRDRNKIWYEIEDQKITATINGISDTFDFTDMPNGELQILDNEGNELIETDLPELPIISARKKNGELFVEILFSIDSTETDERLLFPEPMILHEFQELMRELQERKEKERKEKEEALAREKELQEERAKEEKEKEEHRAFLRARSQVEPTKTVKLNGLDEAVERMLSKAESTMEKEGD